MNDGNFGLNSYIKYVITLVLQFDQFSDFTNNHKCSSHCGSCTYIRSYMVKKTYHSKYYIFSHKSLKGKDNEVINSMGTETSFGTNEN